VHLGTRKALMIWITGLIYALSACAFISPGHCCSQHSHGEGEAHADHDHEIPGSVSDVAFLDLIPLPNGLSLSQRHCCGGLHGEGGRIALHAGNCQRSTEPSRMLTWLAPSDEASHGPSDSTHVHGRASCAFSRASARSPSQESILTVSLLI
jgi:hypothetical protein